MWSSFSSIPAVAPTALSASGPSSPSLISAILIRVAGMSSALSARLNQDCALHVLGFARHVRSSDIRDTTRVTSLATYRSVSADDFVVQHTAGMQGHRFVIATIEIQGAETIRTFARVDFWGKGSYGDYPISQVVMLSDDVGPLIRDAQEGCRLSVPTAQRGLALDAFASLLVVLHDRTHNYDVFIRNCYWHSETIMFCAARQYSKDWLAGSISPEALRKWINRECDAMTCVAEMATEDRTQQLLISTSVGLYRKLRAAINPFVPVHQQIEVHEVDIQQCIEAWQANSQPRV